MNKPFHWFVKITGVLPFLIITRPKIYYEDKSIQNKHIHKKAIIMPDHHSVYDYASIMFTFFTRDISCVVSELMFKKSKWMNWFLHNVGCIKVDRNETDFAFIKTCTDKLNQNKVVEIFPESRIPLDNEETPIPFKPSVTILALESNTLIIPVVTNGQYFSKKRLRVLIGKPINVFDYYDDSKSKAHNITNITNILREKTKQLAYELKSKTKESK